MKDNKFIKISVALTLSLISLFFIIALITHLDEPFVFETKVEAYRDMNIESLHFSFDVEYLTNTYEDIEIIYIILTDDKGGNAYVHFDNISRYTTNTFLYKLNRLPVYIELSLSDVITYDFKKLTIGFSDESIIEKDLDYFKINHDDRNNFTVDFDNFIFSGVNKDIKNGNVKIDTTLLSIESEIYNSLKDFIELSFNDKTYKEPFNLELSKSNSFSYKLKINEPNDLKDAYTKYVFDLRLNFEDSVQYIYDNTYRPDYTKFFDLFKLTRLTGGK